MTVKRWKDNEGREHEFYYSPHGYSLPPWREWLSLEEEHLYNKLNPSYTGVWQMDKMDPTEWRKQLWKR